MLFRSGLVGVRGRGRPVAALNDHASVEHALAGGVAGLGDARRFIARTLAEWAVAPTRIEAVSIVATEFLTNALVHAASEPVLELERSADAVTVRVADRSTAPPEPRAHRTDDGHGLGLRMVDSLADAWGWEHADDGKTVWARFGSVETPP